MEAALATPKQIVAVTSKEMGVSEATVTVHDRNLLMAGLRTEGQRGRGKSEVTYTDAANLIIAVAASRNVKDSAAMVRLYSPLEAREAPAWGDTAWGRTFGEALTELLEVVPANRDEFGGDDANSITVSIYGPRPRATVEIWVHPSKGQPSHIIQYEQPYLKGEDPKYADLTYISQFTQITLGLVGEAIANSTAAKK